MGYETRISTKGQVVLPKEVRDSLAWADGRVLEVIRNADSVTLRAKPAEVAKESGEVILARIKARNTYIGPPVSEEDMRKGVAEAIRKKWEGRFT